MCVAHSFRTWALIFPVTWNIGCCWLSAKDSHLAQWLNNIEVRSYKCPDPLSPSNATSKGLPTPELFPESAGSLCPDLLSSLSSHVDIKNTPNVLPANQSLSQTYETKTEGSSILGSRLPYLRPWISWLYEPINFLLLLKLFSFSFLSLSPKEMWLIITPQLQVSESQRKFCTFI